MRPDPASVSVLARGGIVAYPTEYCFGLGCDPSDPRACRRLARLKRRPLSRGMILLARNARQLHGFVADLPDRALATWPGPHTWIVAPGPRASFPLRGRHEGVAVRITAHPVARRLLATWGGPLVSTSANRHGERPARTAREVRRRFGALVDFVVPGRVGGAPAPTPVRDAASGKLIRPG